MSAAHWIWIGFGASMLALTLMALYTPLYISLRGEAGLRLHALGVAGVGVGPLGVSVERRPGEPARVRVFLFGHCVMDRAIEPREEKPGPDETREERAVRESLEAVLRGLDRWERYLGIAETVRFLVRERRRIRIDELHGRIRYGFPEYEKTGELCGYLWAIQGLLGPYVHLAHEPDWSGKAVLGGVGTVRLRLYPLLFVLDLAWFLVARALTWRRRSGLPPAALAARAEGS